MKPYFPVMLLAVLLPVTSLAANGLTTEQRLERLERRVATVSDLTLRLDAMQRENRQLRGEIETLNHQIQQLERKQRDIYLDIDQRLANLGQSPVPVPAPVKPPRAPAGGGAPVADATAQPPGAARPAAGTPAASADPRQMQADYKAAYALLSPSQKRYEDAAKAFTAFLERYPGSTLAANAQYWLAEAYYVSQKNDQALEAFTQVVEQYPESPKVPGSLYKIGRLQQVNGNNAEARRALQRVVAEYPTAPAAGLSRELLDKLGR
jgi:tol-pal system protein YbgF